MDTGVSVDTLVSMTNHTNTQPIPTTTFAIGADLVQRFQWSFDSVLAVTADEVGVAGAVFADDEGQVTIINHPVYAGLYVRLVQDWYATECAV